MCNEAAKSPSADHMGKLIASGRQEASVFAGSCARHKLPPEAVPGFDIIEEIGRGGMGVVYKAVQLSTKRTVALKVVLGAWFASASAQRRFQREVELTARFQHPGIVRVLESGTTASGQPYYAMDYVEGMALGAWLSAEKRDFGAILRLFVEICEAIEHAHGHGVIHRDLKPGNIIVDRDGKPHVLDFGLSKTIDEATSQDDVTVTMSAPGQVLGTLRYLSPEQARGEAARVDVRTDVYALGVVLYEALTGALPYDEGSSPSETMRRIVEEPPRDPSTLSPSMDCDLETILLKALRKEKEARYQTVAELADDVRRYLAGDPVAARRPSRVYYLRKRLAKHHRMLKIGSIGVLVLLLIVASWLVAESLSTQREEMLRLAHGRWQAATTQYEIERHRRMTHRDFDARESGVRAPERSYSIGLHSQAQRLRSDYPELDEVRLVFAQSLYRLFQSTRSDNYVGLAEGYLQQDYQRRSNAWAFLALLGEVRKSLHDPRAESTLAQAERGMPDTPEAWYLRSFATLDPAQALEFTQRGLAKRASRKTEVLLWRRSAHLKHVLDDVDNACAAAERLIALGDDEYTWRLFAADVLGQANKLDEALERYNTLRSIRPDEPEIHRRLSLAYLARDQYQAAFDAYTEALRLSNPKKRWLFYQRATVNQIMGDFAGALADLDAFSRLGGRSFCGEIRRYLMWQEQIREADATSHDDRLRECQRQAREALRLAETLARGDAVRHRILDWIHGEPVPEDAIEEARSLKQRCEVTYYAGEACLLHGAVEAARRWFQRCVDTGLWYDADSIHFDPMAEYHLAKWRLDQLSRPAKPARRPTGP